MGGFGLPYRRFFKCDPAHKFLFEGTTGICLNTYAPPNLIANRRHLLAMSKGRQQQSKDRTGN